MIIDIFTHMANPKYLEALAARDNGALKKRIDHVYAIARERPQAIDLAKRVELLDRYGIDKQAVTLFNMVDSNAIPGDAAEKVRIAQAINDSMAALMNASKGRIIPAGSVPLEALEQGGLREMDRAVKSLGLRAVAFPSHLNGKPLDSQQFWPFWERASEMELAVYIHPANPPSTVGRPYENAYDLTHVFGWPFETTLALSRIVFSGLLDKYPNFRIISHHLGGAMIPFLFGRIEESYTPDQQEEAMGRVLPRPLMDYYSRFYYDTAVGGSIPAIKCALEVFGAGQLVFATDAPHGPEGGLKRLEEYPRLINSLPIPEGDKRKILGENAQRILKL